MKLGYIRMPDPRPGANGLEALKGQLNLADDLGYHLGYLPKVDPTHFIKSDKFSTKNVKVGLDATAFGQLSPGEMEAAVRSVHNALGGKLNLGIEMCCGRKTTEHRANAQNFETLFSRSFEAMADPKSRFPMREPCPKIIGMPVTGAYTESALAAARGYLPLAPSWLTDAQVARHWPAIVAGATSARRRARPEHWQLARCIVVHDSARVIERYVFGPDSPIRAYYTKLSRRGLIGPDVDAQLKRIVIAGSSSQVAERLLALQEVACEIGTVYVIDPSGRDPEMTKNTMVRLAENVIPMVDSAQVSATKELEKT
ncbi:MAG: hypothetical protein ABJL72_02340 [Roseobacter sp.]